MDTLIADNFLFDKTMDKTPPDSDRVVFKQKNMTPFVDQGNGVAGSYTASRVIVNAQGFGNSSELPDFENAFFVIPEVETLTATATTATITVGAVPSNYCTAPKNNSIIADLRVEQGGNLIVSESQNLPHLVNFVKHCTTSQDELVKHGSTTLYYPDDVGNWSTVKTTNTSTAVKGAYNCANSPVGTTSGPETYNRGLLKRQQMAFPPNRTGNVFTTTTTQTNEYLPIQKATDAQTSITTAGVVLSEIHRARIVYLKDHCDYFKKHPICPTAGYKFSLTVNQCSATASWAFAAGAINAKQLGVLPDHWTFSATGQSTAMPSMMCVGPNSVLGALSTSGASAEGLSLKLETKIDTSADARCQGITLYVPSYIPSEEYQAKLMAQPQIYRTPFKITSSVFTGLTKQAPINLQLFTAIANPRMLVIMPQYAQASQGYASQFSPLNPCPATTDPALSITKAMVRVNAKQILPTNETFSWRHFTENVSKIFALNGGMSSVTTGQIDFWKFQNNYRYYAYDLSVLDASQRDIPQIISFEGFQNNDVDIDLYVFCLSEQGAVFDVLKGGVSLS